MHFDLKQFLLSGKFDPLFFGIKRHQVLEILGTPDGWGPYPQTQLTAEIWVYGSIEFYFPKKGDSLWMVFSDHLNPLEGTHNLILEPWIISDKLRLSEAETILKYEQIKYSLTHLQELDVVEIAFSSGAVCRFEPDAESGAYLLNAFWLKTHE